ncbi:MAG: DUF937 domain-containing protein [Alphaproteobacteria bacterium]|nr:DUF937 domain-containing protein [Alphaproteobacteria bacterium]
MSLLSILVANQGIRLLTSVGGQLFPSSQQAETVTKELLPFVSAAIKKETGSQQGLKNFLHKADNVSVDKFLSDPDNQKLETVASHGEDVVRNILGMADAREAIVLRLAARTGLNATAIGQLLPVVAMLAVGGLANKITPEERSRIESGAAAPPARTGLFGFFGRVFKPRPAPAHFGVAVLGKMIESGVDHEEAWVKGAFGQGD